MKKNEKGFTLIELLVVIVILAVIALIATPIVTSSIDTANQGAAEASAYGSLKAVSEGYLEKQIKDPTVGNTYEFGKDGNPFDVKINGSKPSSGKVTVESDTATIDENNPLIINGYKCTGSSDKVTCKKS